MFKRVAKTGSALFLCGFMAGIILDSTVHAHGSHRPDENEERHKCHHLFETCSKKCWYNRVGQDYSSYESCMMSCFRQHKLCVEKFE